MPGVTRGAGSVYPETPVLTMGAPGAGARPHRLVCSAWIFLCSLSFWLSANLTTRGELQPSMVRLWCIALIATMAICLLMKVTKAQPEIKTNFKAAIK